MLIFYIISEEKLLNYIYVVKGIVKLIIIVFKFFLYRYIFNDFLKLIKEEMFVFD